MCWSGRAQLWAAVWHRRRPRARKDSHPSSQESFPEAAGRSGTVPAAAGLRHERWQLFTAEEGRPAVALTGCSCESWLLTQCTRIMCLLPSPKDDFRNLVLYHIILDNNLCAWFVDIARPSHDVPQPSANVQEVSWQVCAGVWTRPRAWHCQKVSLVSVSSGSSQWKPVSDTQLLIKTVNATFYLAILTILTRAQNKCD